MIVTENTKVAQAKTTVNGDCQHETHPDELHGHQLESFGLETLNDLADESTLHAVGLNHDESAFCVRVTHDESGEYLKRC